MKSRIESNSNHRIFKVHNLGWTNTKPNRIVITEDRMGIKKRKVLTWTHAQTDNTRKEAQRYLESIGINCVGHGFFNDECYIFSDSWTNNNGEFIELNGKISK